MRTFLTATSIVLLLLSGGAEAGTDPIDKCVDSKAKGAGKKAQALLKAFGKNISKNPDTKLSANVSKAQSKFTKAFTKAESKGCGTMDDAATIEAKVDAFVFDTTLGITGQPSLSQIADAGDCVGGPLSRCRVGDYLLENNKIRVVVQDIQRNLFGIGQYGGQIIDADLRREDGDPEIDNFEEFSTSINVENTAHYTDLTIINAGGADQPAVLRATGPDDMMDFLNPSSVLASFGFAFPPAADDTDLPVEISTDYILEAHKNYVTVETTVTNTSGSSVPLFFGEFINGSGQVELFQPAYGFGETLLTGPCSVPPVEASNPCNAIIYKGVDDAAGVSYGYVHEEPGTTQFTASGVSVPLLGANILAVFFGAPANFTLEPSGDPGDSLTFTRYFIVGDGTVSSILDTRNEIQGISTGTITGTVETATGGAQAGADVAILGSVGAPESPSTLPNNVVSHTNTDASGNFSVTVAPGDYDVVVNIEGHPYEGGGSTPALHPVTVTVGGSVSTGTITIPDTGSLQVDIADGSANPLAGKVSVVGFDPSPAFNNDSNNLIIANSASVFRDRAEDGLTFGLTRVMFVDPSGVSDTVPLEPGSYEVVVSHGPEYSIDSTPVTVVANTTETFDAELAPVIDSSGFIGSDFHVHSIESADSEVTREERVISMMAEGLEFFTPSDHGFRADFQPMIVANGWDDLVTTATSGEITTFDYGHFNAWPMTIDPSKVNGGSVDHGGAVATAGEDFPSFGNYNLTPEEIIAAAHADPGTDTVQINHIASHFGLSASGDLGSGLAIDTGVVPPISSVPPAARRLDPAKEDAMMGYFTDTFDALEIWIGAGSRGARNRFIDVNAGTWINLINQGILSTGIADSDTHQRIATQAGLPRNMVASTVTDLTLLDPEVMSATVNEGRSFGTNGPMLRFRVEAASTAEEASLEIGDPTTISTIDGEVDITVDIQSPVWAEFDTVEYYVNSATIQTIIPNLETGAGLVDVHEYLAVPDFIDTPSVSPVVVDGSVPGGSRLEATSSLHLSGLTQDVWIVVMVKGTDGVSKPLFPVIPNALDDSVNTTVGDLTDGNLGEDGVLALAFTNPLYVDVDGGGWSAPGLNVIVPSPSGAFLDGAAAGLFD